MTRKKKRTTYTKEFKLEAVRMVQQDTRSVVEIAEDLGILPNMLHRWVRELRVETEEAFRGQGNRSSVEEENRQLKKRIRQLEQEKQVLEKASAYFAQFRK